MAIKTFISGAAALVISGAAFAQSYPVKAVRIIVPHPAGSVVDVPIRGAAQTWSQALGQPFVVDNRAGAEGIIGAEACAKATPDGHVLCSTSTGTRASLAAVGTSGSSCPMRWKCRMSIRSSCNNRTSRARSPSTR